MQLHAMLQRTSLQGICNAENSYGVHMWEPLAQIQQLQSSYGHKFVETRARLLNQLSGDCAVDTILI